MRDTGNNWACNCLVARRGRPLRMRLLQRSWQRQGLALLTLLVHTCTRMVLCGASLATSTTRVAQGYPSSTGVARASTTVAATVASVAREGGCALAPATLTRFRALTFYGPSSPFPPLHGD